MIEMSMLFTNDEQGTHAPSLYAATCNTPLHSPLSEHISADICVIGAGYTGLSTALHCAQLGYSVVIIDAHRVGWGASGRNGGQLGSGFNMPQADLEKQLGLDRAQALWLVSENAKATIHRLCMEHAIDIEYQAGIINACHRERYVSATRQYRDALATKYQYEQLESLSKNQLQQLIDSPSYFGGVLDHGAGHINPLKLALGLAQIATAFGAKIYEKSHVLSIQPSTNGESLISTESGSVQAQHVVMACNGYSSGFNKNVEKRVMPINNFIVATEPLGDGAVALLAKRHAVFDSRFVVNYFRLTKDNRLLFGGGETYGYHFPKDIRQVVSKPLLQVFPQLRGIKFDYAWGGTLAITRSRLPFITKYNESTYSAGGYSGHGVALAVESGKAIAEAISGDTATFDTLKELPCAQFPGGSFIRPALLAGAMTFYSVLDRF